MKPFLVKHITLATPNSYHLATLHSPNRLCCPQSCFLPDQSFRDEAPEKNTFLQKIGFSKIH